MDFDNLTDEAGPLSFLPSRSVGREWTIGHRHVVGLLARRIIDKSKAIALQVDLRNKASQGQKTIKP